MIEELITFNLCGKMAHFRKFYSNASALSHTIPPRTTIMGILASIVGLPRDSYYSNSKENFEFDKILVGIQIQNKVRKINQKLNYLKVDKANISDFRGFNNRSQISTELIVPLNIREGIVSYKLYVATEDKANPLYQTLKANIKNQYSVFGISLGGANMQGYIQISNKFEIQFSQAESKSKVEICSAIPVSQVEKIHQNSNITLEQDILPHHFELIDNIKDFSQNRVAKTHTLLYSTSNDEVMKLDIKDTTNILHLPESNINISIF